MDVEISEACGKVLLSKARHKCLFGGRGAAKSWSIATYIIARCFTERVRVVCCRQFQVSIRDSSKALIERRIRDLGLSDHFIINEQTIVNVRTGSDFLFIGLERNPDSIRSLEGANI